MPQKKRFLKNRDPFASFFTHRKRISKSRGLPFPQFLQPQFQRTFDQYSELLYMRTEQMNWYRRITGQSGSGLNGRIEIQKYGLRNWAVYIDGELLCVTVYLKGAEAVKDMLDTMMMELNECRERRVA